MGKISFISAWWGGRVYTWLLKVEPAASELLQVIVWAGPSAAAPAASASKMIFSKKKATYGLFNVDSAKVKAAPLPPPLCGGGGVDLFLTPHPGGMCGNVFALWQRG